MDFLAANNLCHFHSSCQQVLEIAHSRASATHQFECNSSLSSYCRKAPERSFSQTWSRGPLFKLAVNLPGPSNHGVGRFGKESHVFDGSRRVNSLPSWALQSVANQARLGYLLGDEQDRIEEDGGFPPTFVKAPNRRVVAVGDLHGDMTKTRHALRLAGVLSTAAEGFDSWIGGSTVFVQVGDVLDRGDDEIEIMSLLKHLDSQARREGGAVYQISGNHETMNVYGDFRYVTTGGYKEADLFNRWAAEYYNYNYMLAFDRWYFERTQAKAVLKENDAGPWNPIGREMQKRIRTRLFEPGGPLAREMARYSTVLQVNDTLFAHGGVLPHHVEYGLERLNEEVSRWMMATIDEETGEPEEQPFLATRGYNSVMWSRLYSREHYETTDEKHKACTVLSSAIKMLENCSRIVVGHTPQEVGCNSTCNKQVWRIDVGMSSGIMDAPAQVIVINGSDVQVLKAKHQSLVETPHVYF